MKLFRRLEFPLRAPTTPLGVEPLIDKHRTGADYETEWARSFAARWVRVVLLESVVRPTIRLLADPHRVGIDRLDDLRRDALDDERDVPVIFAANHHSHVDTPLLLTSLPEPWRHKVFVGAAADYFFKTRATSVASALALNAIPIERTKVARKSADHAAKLIGDGWSMAIFPEGGRSPDGWGQPFRGGAAYLAIRCAVPVVPVHLEGTSRILRKGKKAPTPARTTVTFGAPMRPDEGEDSRRFAARIERAVAALADEASTDWYVARRRAHRADTPSLSGPEATGWRRQWALGERGPKGGRIKPKAWPDLS
ncbi:MAG: lysophospholipid acyltransferase family protein [Acidimicrobiales bacterium]